jgi:hypothetical protein
MLRRMHGEPAAAARTSETSTTYPGRWRRFATGSILLESGFLHFGFIVDGSGLVNGCQLCPSSAISRPDSLKLGL